MFVGLCVPVCVSQYIGSRSKEIKIRPFEHPSFSIFHKTLYLLPFLIIIDNNAVITVYVFNPPFADCFLSLM